MILQIAGAILVTTAVLCFTWHMTEMKRTKAIAESHERMQRAEMTQRIFESNTMKMYEEERQARIAAETKCGILQQQLKRAREQMSKVTIGK